MKIQVRAGKYKEDTCTVQKNLIENQANYPAIRKVIEYSDQRMISTLIASGATDQSVVGHIKTKIGDAVSKGKSIGANAYQFDVMGRIQQASVINSQVGTTQSDGTFQLSMKDSYLVPGMVALFHGQGFQARVMGSPQGSSGNLIYTFKSPDGRIFDWNTHVAPQQGQKTCFGGHTSYGEKSLRGYGRSHFSDSFIQHMTIQRKATAISGGAGSDVLWVHYEMLGKNGNTVSGSGWYYKDQQQARLQLMMEDEFQKWFGLSSMKGANGELLTESLLGNDPETGLPIIQGDGVIPQISGGNELYGSGVNGNATIDDIIDMMTMLEKKCNTVSGKQWYVVTGTDGYSNFQRLMKEYLGLNLVVNTNPSAEIGGVKVDVGYHFQSFNVDGNKITLVKHPMFDDDQRFTERGADGKLLQSSVMYFIDASALNGTSNIEILSKKGNGFNRDFVSAEINGMTGKSGQVVTSEDAVRFEILMENMIVVYNTTSCGIIHKMPN
jgi:hypothetical protein